jgi:hypothetical protein
MGAASALIACDAAPRADSLCSRSWLGRCLGPEDSVAPYCRPRWTVAPGQNMEQDLIPAFPVGADHPDFIFHGIQAAGMYGETLRIAPVRLDKGENGGDPVIARCGGVAAPRRSCGYPAARATGAGRTVGVSTSAAPAS